MITSKVTARAQTTIPRGVRDALEIGPGDELVYEIRDGHAILRRRRRDDSEPDPVLGAFLEFLASDMRKRPEALRPVPETLIQRARELVEGVAFDPDESIDGDVAL